MTDYVNTGAGFTRDDGSFWEHAGVGEPTRRERARWGHKLVPAEQAKPEPPDPLDGVEFASSQADKLARDEGLVAEDFAGEEGSGADGAFGVADVRVLIGEDEGEDA